VRAALTWSLAGLVLLALAACGGSSTPAASPGTALPQAAITDHPATPLPAPTVAGTIAFVKTVNLSADAVPQTDIYVVKTDGSGLKRLTDANGMEEHPAWSPDGRKITYSQTLGDYGQAAAIWIVNADGSRPVRLTPPAVHGVWPNWSPDGTRIAFSRVMPSGSQYVYVMNADGSGIKAVGKKLELATQTFAPDGRIIGLRSSEVYAVNPDGSGLTPLTTGADLGADGGTFALSPDGSNIVLENSIGQLRIAPVQGGGTPLMLATSVSYLIPDPWTVPSWSPDGRVLAISNSDIFGVRGAPIYIMNPDGSGLTAVPGVTKANDAVWRPQ
jgi:Tol biopolymer transport system component